MYVEATQFHIGYFNTALLTIRFHMGLEGNAVDRIQLVMFSSKLYFSRTEEMSGIILFWS